MCRSIQGLHISAYIQMIIGIFCIILGFVEIGDEVERYYHKVIAVPFLGFWIGLWFLTGGIVGVLASFYSTTHLKVLIIVYIFVSVTSTFLAGLMTACYYLTIKFWKYQDTHYPAPYGITWVITILGSIELLVSLWACVCSWNIICTSSCCNLDVHSQTEGFQGDFESTSRRTGASSAFVFFEYDNVVPVAASGPNKDPCGTPENIQTEVDSRNEEMPPSYEMAMQNI
ncbi:uncharacterized protein LOC116295351 [Actinia tenebrosa]|uniref:Uncharacterized protein LOC116295351 n=1 Tax=Actinia tenebrosa TaxID=6105 RepID=A0A6P8I2C4_ACTTE|nr:uncharacterized protein LOC116295351 [Actinia tenebrosa]